MLHTYKRNVKVSNPSTPKAHFLNDSLGETWLRYLKTSNPFWQISNPFEF